MKLVSPLFQSVAKISEGEIFLLVAFGEISTFAGALFGVDYSYKFKINNHE